MKIYVCGNLLLDYDSTPLKIINRLNERFPAIEFLEFDPSENFPDEEEIRIIDSVSGIEKGILIEDMAQLKIGKALSLHDADLGFNIKINKKFGRLRKVKIIGIPMNASGDSAFSEAERLISSLS